MPRALVEPTPVDHVVPGRVDHQQEGPQLGTGRVLPGQRQGDGRLSAMCLASLAATELGSGTRRSLSFFGDRRPGVTAHA